MKKSLLGFVILCAYGTTAVAVEIAISTQANWWTQVAADREMQEIVDNVTAVPVQRFSAGEHDALADWVIAHTGNGVSDLLILCGVLPNTLYPAVNLQPDGSLLELFVDAGNCVINTGDWIFYVGSTGINGTAALPNVMDIPSMDMWDDNTPVTVTADGQRYTPSLTDFLTDRAIHLDALTNDWYAELILALAADGNRAEPVIVRNAVTGGRIGIFFQTADQDNDPRGEVISEWINNWYLKVVADPRVAGNPDPANEATDVPRDVALSWTAGQSAATHDVYFGTVFYDVNDAARADPRGVLVSQAQSATTYDPIGRLDFETTYYWRVDEVNAAPDHSIFKGKVWSFTSEPYAYAIANVTATSNGEPVDDAGPENTVNGSGLDAADQHSTMSDDMWLARPSDGPLWIQFEFDRVYQLHQMLIWNYNVQFELMLGFGIKDATIEYSTDGADWTSLGEVELARGTARTTYMYNSIIDLAGVAAKYVRLTVNSGYGPMGQFGLSEVRFMSIPAHARQPQPADGTVGVEPNTVLGWRPGRQAALHEVHIGTDLEALAPVATVADSSAAPEDLQYATTYFWRIDEVNEAEAVTRWEGDVWSFSTAAYGVVDDMEGYTDDVDGGTTIFQTWIDGWENGTGSTVGHLDAPFAERTIVYAGRQSMPLEYDNTAAPSYSEAVRAFEVPQDWTRHGVESLGLYFRGTRGSDGQLYVKVNGARIAYDGDPADLGRALWQPWNIDLSAVATDLRNVTELTIGVDGAGAKGRLYIDAIRLYPDAVELIAPTEPDAADLVGYYALDGNANDGSGHGHHGSLIGAPTYGPGVQGQAIQLNGINQYVDFGNPADWPAGRAARSMTGWAKSSVVDPGWRWIATYGSAGTGTAMFIGMSGTDLYGGGYADDVMLADFWRVEEWHHIGLTYDGDVARLYADGVEVTSAAKSWNLTRSRAHIGRQVNDLAEFWVGAIDEVRIYGRALSPDEMAWLAGRTMPMHKPF
ncbi:LamG-like jellyroll fold domain-containing protein [Anaerobaca lacustris]|uniref:Discoidin domain-containing protein n=1 Tax=Anaerobaca lacustris TaxID=3044600 RepID=A0AAW6U474_9BACT|nr:discoidin domain-containing protein [Sedimentisphaerales bacterium M17dextr]